VVVIPALLAVQQSLLLAAVAVGIKLLIRHRFLVGLGVVLAAVAVLGLALQELRGRAMMVEALLPRRHMAQVVAVVQVLRVALLLRVAHPDMVDWA